MVRNLMSLTPCILTTEFRENTKNLTKQFDKTKKNHIIRCSWFYQQKIEKKGDYRSLQMNR